MSVEPSMEEILSSIKRIIAEEEAPTGRRRATRPLASTPNIDGGTDSDGDEVLELSDPMPAHPRAIHVLTSPPAPAETAPAPTESAPFEEPTAEAVPAPTLSEATIAPAPAEPSAPATATADPIISSAAVDATRDALASLSRLMVKSEPQGDGTLEGLVREMLRPMLREWLDANLPDMVEAMVSREIARISGLQR